jgi:hypothetical protein
MVGYATQASWILIATFALSALYELYRSTAKAGTSRYDSMREFLTQALLISVPVRRPSGRW